MLRATAALFAGLALAALPAAADLDAALAALDRGDAARARELLRAEEAEVAFHLALVAEGEERSAALARAGALVTDGWLAPALRAVAASDAERFADAAAAWREATAAAPDEPRLWKLLGDALRRGEAPPGEARQAYERAVALAPGYSAALLELGRLRLDAGEFGPAYNAFNHAVGEDGRPVAALLGRATASLYVGDRDGAIADLERAAGIAEPGVDRYRALMGVVYVRAYERRLPEGLDRAEQAVAMWQELGRGDMAAAAANATARVLLETGDAVAAENWYERGGRLIAVAALSAEERTIWRVRELHGRARCAAARRERARADDLAIQAMQLMDTDPANAEHYAWIGPYLTGYLRFAERDYAAALEAFNASDTTRPYIQYMIGETHARRRDRNEARAWYQRALAGSTGLDPESVVVRPLAEAWLARNP